MSSRMPAITHHRLELCLERRDDVVNLTHRCPVLPRLTHTGRRRRARHTAAPAPSNDSAPRATRVLLLEWEAPPAPVCGTPTGMMVDAGTPVVGVVVVDVLVVDVVVVDVVATKLFTTVVMQVTALPPPVAVPLHWLTVTGNADVRPVTVQPTVVLPA